MSAKLSKDIWGWGKGCIDSKFPAMQHAKKVMSDSPGLVDFAFGLVASEFCSVTMGWGEGGGRGLNSSGSFIFGSFPSNSQGKPQAPSCLLVIALV